MEYNPQYRSSANRGLENCQCKDMSKVCFRCQKCWPLGWATGRAGRAITFVGLMFSKSFVEDKTTSWRFWCPSLFGDWNCTSFAGLPRELKSIEGLLQVRSNFLWFKNGGTTNPQFWSSSVTVTVSDPTNSWDWMILGSHCRICRVGLDGLLLFLVALLFDLRSCDCTWAVGPLSNKAEYDVPHCLAGARWTLPWCEGIQGFENAPRRSKKYQQCFSIRKPQE